MPLYLFYTMVQKLKNDQKLKIKGGGSCLNLKPTHFTSTLSKPTHSGGTLFNFLQNVSRKAMFSDLVLSKPTLRPAGGVKHSDSDLVETRMLSAKKALRWIEGSILSNSRKFWGGGWWVFPL